MHDQRVEIAGVSERAPHHLRIGHALVAVGEGDRAGRLEQADLGHLLAFEPFGQRRHRMHVHDRGVARAAQHEIHRRRIVDDRRCVRLADDGGDAAGRGGLACRCQRLAVAGAGLADEGAHVDETGRDQLAAAIDHVGAFRHAAGADTLLGFADEAVGDQQVADDIEVARRIDDPGVGEQDRAAVGQHRNHVRRSAGYATKLPARPCGWRRPFRPVRGSATARRRRRSSRSRRRGSSAPDA